MSKPLVNTTQLVEADFREIKNLVHKKYAKTYSVGYIRKVCKHKRINANIKSLAEDYILLVEETRALISEKEDKLINKAKPK